MIYIEIPVAKSKEITATKENKEDVPPVGGDRFSRAKETKQMSKVRNTRPSWSHSYGWQLG